MGRIIVEVKGNEEKIARYLSGKLEEGGYGNSVSSVRYQIEHRVYEKESIKRGPRPRKKKYFDTLRELGGVASAEDVAKIVGVSYVSAHKALESLLRDGRVEEVWADKGNKKTYRIKQ